MFESLSEKLSGILDKLTGRGALSEEDVNAAMREVRRALLEADVALEVVRSFVDRTRTKAVGASVIKSVKPGQMVVKIVHDSLVETLGTESQAIDLNAPAPVAIMLVGLQGAGKTTTAAKIAKRLTERDKRKVLMASLDVKRPAAQEQLAVLGRRVCEQEYDILLALGYAAPLKITDPLEDTVGPATAPHDRPTGSGLLRAVREFLATEVTVTDPSLAFHARVAANALRIAEREVMLAAGHARDRRARLAALGCADDAELCAAIRDGSLDHRFDDVIAAVRAMAVDKLAVANPSHLARPG